MRKQQRKDLKDEKRILKLMYRTGWIDELAPDLASLEWVERYTSKRVRRRKNKKISFPLTEKKLHVTSSDYWGEISSSSIVCYCREAISMQDAQYCPFKGWHGVNVSVRTSKGLISYLEELPILKNDSLFNKYLIVEK